MIQINHFSFFFFKQKTAYEMRISDWSSDVCSSDLRRPNRQRCAGVTHHGFRGESDTNKGCGAGLDNGKEADGDASWVRCGCTSAAPSVLLASPSPRGVNNVA